LKRPEKLEDWKPRELEVMAFRGVPKTTLNRDGSRKVLIIKESYEKLYKVNLKISCFRRWFAG
tara:strand:- start:116 stop:304 length:189 start_codon:yes stop_codon:yes gene_type:complete